MRRLGAALALALALSGSAAATEPSTRPPPLTPALSEGMVNLNAAAPEELERLPGIGPSRAHAIVEYRAVHPFKKVEEVTKIKGIGRRTFGKLRPYLTLSGATTLVRRPRR